MLGKGRDNYCPLILLTTSPSLYQVKHDVGVDEILAIIEQAFQTGVVPK